ncbi:hypothetical protein QUC31_016772 [Theobroma cacao]
MEHLHFLLLVFTIFQTRLYLGMSKMGCLEGARADKEALLSFKFQVTVPQNALSGWTRNSSHCTWYGVSCSSKGSRVQSLHLSWLGLGGTLGPQLSNFTFLHTLNLSHNLFHGQIQLEFSRLQLLQQIDLKNNFINGTIPAILSTCHNLETLRLEENRFSGKLPPELGSLQKLKTLSVSINNLTGSIPRTFGNLSSLTSLNLARNQSLAEIPSELGCLRNLQYFQLSGNHLTGEIPSSVYNVSSLFFLSVTQNNLGGKLPNDIVQAPPNLRQLYLAQNSFEGIVPGSISNASGIEYLDLSMNRFHGPVPLFGNMKKLIWLNLGSNFLSSTTALNFQLIDYLTSCEIPKNIAKLKKLQSFSVFQNMLSGEIPDIFGNLTQPSDDQMDNNKLSGKIPNSLGFCQQIETLNLTSNRLNGSIPNEIFRVSSLTNLNLSHNKLWGPLPSEVGNLKQLQVVDVSDNQETMGSAVVIKKLQEADSDEMVRATVESQLAPVAFAIRWRVGSVPAHHGPCKKEVDAPTFPCMHYGKKAAPGPYPQRKHRGQVLGTANVTQEIMTRARVQSRQIACDGSVFHKHFPATYKPQFDVWVEEWKRLLLQL